MRGRWRLRAAEQFRTAGLIRLLVGEAGTPGGESASWTRRWIYEFASPASSSPLGATSWRVEEIRPDRVVVSRAPGMPARSVLARRRPWAADRDRAGVGRIHTPTGGRPRSGERGRSRPRSRLRANHDLDDLAVDNVIAYLDDERAASRDLPTDRRIVVEKFRDELSDWRIVILTPFGVESRAVVPGHRNRAWHRSSATAPRRSGPTTALPSACPKARRCRVCAARTALSFAEEVETLLSGDWGRRDVRRPVPREHALGRCSTSPPAGSRTPLWQQRQRSPACLAVASRYGSFPIIVETYREWAWPNLFEPPPCVTSWEDGSARNRSPEKWMT